jgi:hypothetical protein
VVVVMAVLIVLAAELVAAIVYITVGFASTEISATKPVPANIMVFIIVSVLRTNFFLFI